MLPLREKLMRPGWSVGPVSCSNTARADMTRIELSKLRGIYQASQMTHAPDPVDRPEDCGVIKNYM
jgi:hypothetical protein